MIHRIISRFPEDLRHVMILMVGNGLALSIPVLISPLLTRIYGVADFGAYTMYIAVVGFIGAFSSGRYEYAILVARSRNAAVQLFKLSMLVVTGVAIICFLILWVLGDAAARWLELSETIWFVYLIPLNMLIFVLIRVSANGLNREKQYSSISTGKTVKAIGSGASQLLIGYMAWLPGGLIIGKFVGDLISAAYQSFRLERVKGYLSEKLMIRRILYLAKKHRRYPQINALHAFLNASSNNAIPLIIGSLFSQEVVGLFGLSFMVTMAPVQLLGTAVYQVFSQKISVLFNEGRDLYGYTIGTIKKLALVISVPFIVLLLFGDNLFGFVFGEEWTASGVYAQILAVYLYLTFLLTPVTYLPLVLNEHKKALFFEIISTIVKIGSLIVGGLIGDIYTALILFSVSGTVVYIFTLLWIIGLSRRKHV